MRIQTRELCKCYRNAARIDVRAIDGITLDIETGTFTVLTGPSGSGKSTLLSLLGALQRPTRGQVLIDSVDLSRLASTELTRIRRRMGFVFQNVSLIPTLSVLDNLTYVLIPRGIPKPERIRRAHDIVARLGLELRLNARASELSGGEQQRVAVARALIAEPEVILADEPTSNLDPASGNAVLEMLCSAHTNGTTLILCSHDPLAVAMSTRVITLSGGKLIAN